MSFKCILIFILFFSAAGCFAQDVIYQKNGGKIYCRIQGEDSTKIYYSLGNRKTQFEIKKANVYRYVRATVKKTAIDTSGQREFSEIIVLNFFGGIANPIGEFASKDANSDKSGLAKTGFLFHSSAILKLSDYFGFNLSYYYQTHPFADNLITEQFIAANPGINFSSTSTNWIVNGFFGGIHLTAPIKNIPHLSIDGDLSFGLPKYHLPAYVLVASAGGQYIILTQEASVTTAPTFLGAFGLKYRVDKFVGLSLNVSYLQSRAYFNNIYSHSSTGASSYDKYNQKIATFNVQLGLSFFIFGKAKKVNG